jgi:uncharacterized membrane protein YGL010W
MAGNYLVLMRNIQSWLQEYEKNHQHPINRAIHTVAVPCIVVSIFAFFWCLPFPHINNAPILNWSTILATAIAIYYIYLSTTLGLIFIIGAVFQFLGFYWLQSGFFISLEFVAVVLFVFGWVLQFIGHTIEGKRPSFFEDLRFLLIGPLWVLASFCEKLGLKFANDTKK